MRLETARVGGRVVDDAAADEHALDRGTGVVGVAGDDDDVGVLARLEGTELAIDPSLSV